MHVHVVLRSYAKSQCTNDNETRRLPEIGFGDFSVAHQLSTGDLA